MKITEIAREAAKNAKEALDACKILGIVAKSQQSSVTEEQALRLFQYLASGAPIAPTAEIEPAAQTKKAAPKKETKKEKTAEIEKPEARVAPQPIKKEDPQLNPPPRPIEIARKTAGLTIVTKKRAAVSIPSFIIGASNEAFAHEYGKRKIASISADEERKPKKEKKIALSGHKKEQGRKIEILRDRDLGGYDHFEENMVVMPDLSIGVSDFLIEQERNQRNARRDYEKAKALGGGVNRAGGGGDGGISRGRRRRSRLIDRGRDRKETISVAEINEDVRVYEFADLINQPISAVIKKLFDLGMMVTKNDFLGKDAIEILAEEFGVEVRTKDVAEELDYVALYNEAHKDRHHAAQTRPPIVTIMGHVDHGKTSLLDYIRDSRVASGEAGGITQHIGAYTVVKNSKAITFIDTPGHEAFSQMRARGATITDVVVIVVAADDGVMPQTKEAISHARASKCPIIVAINKMDKQDANPDKVKAELAEAGLTPQDWGGDAECVGVSAKTGQGVESLLETILLQAELMELKAERDTRAKAVVIESSLEKGRGPVATIIVRNGSLHAGDNVVAGTAFGRIRAIVNDRGAQVKRLNPSEAGRIVGLDITPASGDYLIAMDDLEAAKRYAQKRADYERSRALSLSTKATLEDLGELIAEGKLKRLPIILKADAQGALEAIASAISKLKNEEVKAEIAHSAVGEISASDLALAGASEHAVILGFHIKPSQIVKDRAKALGVTIKSYDVIYDLLDDVSALLGGMLSKVTKEQLVGKAEVRQIFEIPKFGKIAGCMVIDGLVTRGAAARVMRGEDEICRSRVETLKRFKDDAKEVGKGLECGVGLSAFDDAKAGDLIEVYKSIEIEAVFEAAKM
ncbi:MAG: translation initiation factor IF-2 [Helicobacteraceae bacterium]|nr:translation initiation factor IF-2 [Helicobacteraceae bacterium]